MVEVEFARAQPVDLAVKDIRRGYLAIQLHERVAHKIGPEGDALSLRQTRGRETASFHGTTLRPNTRKGDRLRLASQHGAKEQDAPPRWWRKLSQWLMQTDLSSV